MSTLHIGLVGLGVMGRNLALNMARHDFAVVGYDLDVSRREASATAFAGERASVALSLREMVDVLEPPRRVLLMVPAGPPVDSVLEDLRPLVAGGDVVVDGGNSHFSDTRRRGAALGKSGIHFVGAGISGGEQGALLGPAIMAGGPPDGYRLVEPMLVSIAARSAHGPCCTHIGPDGAGHFVKMVHNGIEYGVMQLICEAYDVLGKALGMSAPEISEVFGEWADGDLGSYLMEISAAVLAKRDDETGRPLVDLILDRAGQKGTGRWTSQSALDLGVATPTINAALEARILSAIKDQRVEASKVLNGDVTPFEGEPNDAVEILRNGLRLAILTSYAQGFALMAEASAEYGWDLDLRDIARIWTGGCIIRAKLLDEVMAAFEADPGLGNLMVAPAFAALVNDLQGALRRSALQAISAGVPCLALAASLGYVDGYRSERLPANLLQAQRDCFGAHTYQRIDRPRGETFHTEW